MVWGICHEFQWLHIAALLTYENNVEIYAMSSPLTSTKLNKEYFTSEKILSDM